MEILDDKLIVHEFADETMENILDGFFIVSSLQENHYNSNTDSFDSNLKLKKKQYKHDCSIQI